MKTILAILIALLPILALAQNETPDSIKTQELNEVVVEAQMQRTSATVSTYIPTSKQKTASQTGTDLLNRMGIPQLRLTVGDNATVRTASGQDVEIFIDFQPASSADLSGMRMTDVKKVEYYEYPEDPRFQGKAHVVNFVMLKYEYGGYVKAYANEFFIANSGQLNLYSKIQYKKMTYDIAVGGYYNNMPHNYTNTSETYRLPQEDGTIKEFERISEATDSKFRRRYYWPTFKALYATDKVSIQNVIGTNFDHYPVRFNNGVVRYSPSDFDESTYGSESSNRNNSITYNGYWNFILSNNNILNFTPYYSYSHTNQQASYKETDAETINNNAIDDSHRLAGTLNFTHKFGKAGTLMISAFAWYIRNHTAYSGNTVFEDERTNVRTSPQIKYSINTEKFHGQFGLGWAFDHSTKKRSKEFTNAPVVDLSVQFSPNNKHSIVGEFHYRISGDVSNYNSAAIIQQNPLLSCTGNPNIKPYESYSGNISYTWLPSNKFSFTAYGNVWTIGNRSAFNYEASSTGVLRTIIQPAGGYTQGAYGAYGTLRLIGGKLQLTAELAHTLAHNGYPYNWNKNHIDFALQAGFYTGKWNFGGYFVSGGGYPDGCMVGTWMKTVSNAAVWAGWANPVWNFKLVVANPYRWNWNESTSVMHSKNYDITEKAYNSNAHCFIQLSATYTFGFGKKVKVGNEANQQMGVNSGILK